MATPEEMDRDTPLAEEALNEVSNAAVLEVGAWQDAWLGKVGHKRLGRLLMQAYREEMNKKGGDRK